MQPDPDQPTPSPTGSRSAEGLAGDATPAQAAIADHLRRLVGEFVVEHTEEVRTWMREAAAEQFDGEAFQARLAAELGKVVLRGWFEDFVQRLIAADPRFTRQWLADLVAVEATRAARTLEVRARVAFGDWTRAFALDGGRAEARALPPAREHRGGLRQVALPPDMGAGDLDAALARDGDVLPDTDQREGYYGERHFDFWVSGLIDQRRIAAQARAHGVNLCAGAAVLELGCASGRVLRHFVHQEDGLDVLGCDIQRSHVDWMVKHLPARLRVFQNTVLPTLPLGDASLELVYALSVFTHIDEFDLSWMAELARVLRPGALAYLSVHTEHTWALLSPGMALYHDLLAVREQVQDHDIDDAFLAGPMPGERAVFRWTSALSNNTSVFLRSEYIHRAWGRFLEVVEIQREASGYQDVVVLRRR